MSVKKRHHVQVEGDGPATMLRPALRSTGEPTCSSSFLSCALTAEVERPSRSAAFAKLPSSMPSAKLRRTSRSKVMRRMPGLNGAQLCQALRELPATRDLSLAILTGSYEDGLISDCLAAGASECMSGR